MNKNILKIAKKFEEELITKKAKIYDQATFLRIKDEYEMHFDIIFNEADQALKKLKEGQSLSDNISSKEKDTQISLILGLLDLSQACKRTFYNIAKYQDMVDDEKPIL